jgi:hypothetical protein
LTFNGPSNKADQRREALSQSHRGLTDVSRVKKQGSREALNESIGASRSSEKNKEGREAFKGVHGVK